MSQSHQENELSKQEKQKLNPERFSCQLYNFIAEINSSRGTSQLTKPTG